MRWKMGGPERPWRAVALAIPLAVIAFHIRAAIPGRAFGGSDPRNFFFAMRDALEARLRAGEWPGWQRGPFMGIPVAGDPQNGLFDFTTWLTLPWDAPRALTIGTLIHLIVAGWGMAYWMGKRGLGPAEAFFAAVAFALGAKQTAHILHWNFAASTCWWPWMLAGVEAFASEGRGRYLAMTALAGAGSWFGGSPQMAYFGTLVAGSYAAVHAPVLWRRRRIDAVLALAAAPVGLLLAAPMVLPVMEAARFGPRGAGVTYDFATSWRWPDRWALSFFLLPRSYNDAWGGAHTNAWEMIGYLGILPLGLMAAASLRKGKGWFFCALMVVGIWLGFGEISWLGLHRFFYDWLPGYGSFRNPTRTMMVASFASAVLAAEGLAALRRHGWSMGWRGPAGRAMAALGLVILVAPLLAVLSPFGLKITIVPAVIALVLASLGLAWLFSGRQWGWSTAWSLGAAALLTADVIGNFAYLNKSGWVSAEGPVLAAFAPIMPKPPEPRRLASVTGWGRSTNDALRLDWESTSGYGPVSIERIRLLLEATRTGSLQLGGPFPLDHNFPKPDPTSPIWPLLATPVVVSDRPLPFPVLARGPMQRDLPLAAHPAPALPRVYWVGKWSVVGDGSPELWSQLVEAASGRTVVLAPPAPAPEAPSAIEGPVVASRVEVFAERLEATIEAPDVGWVVVVDPHYPGWTAEVDGAETPILRANYAFQALPVTAGSHHIRLEYHNRWPRLGTALAGVALSGLLAVLAWRRRSSAPPAQ
jgi:hypothetical protein